MKIKTVETFAWNNGESLRNHFDFYEKYSMQTYPRFLGGDFPDLCDERIPLRSQMSGILYLVKMFIPKLVPWKLVKILNERKTELLYQYRQLRSFSSIDFSHSYVTLGQSNTLAKFCSSLKILYGWKFSSPTIFLLCLSWCGLVLFLVHCCFIYLFL